MPRSTIARTGEQLAHRSTGTFRARLLAVVALLALAATYLTPLVNADWNAWRYDHGHASLTGVHQHTHPWQVSAPALGDTADTGAGEHPGLVFTNSEESTPGMTAIWRLTPIDVSVSLLLVEVSDASTPTLSDNPSVPASPPPRSALSHLQPSLREEYR